MFKSAILRAMRSRVCMGLWIDIVWLPGLQKHAAVGRPGPTTASGPANDAFFRDNLAVGWRARQCWR